MSKPALSRNHAPIGGSEAPPVAGLVARRPDVGVRGARRREADHVVDLARRDLVVADEAGQDRQAGGVAGRPAERPHRVRAQVPGGARARPSTTRRRSAGRRCTAPRAGRRHGRRRGRGGRRSSSTRPRSARSAGSDTGRGRSRRRTSNETGHARLGARHGGVGDPDRPAVPRPAAEVGLEPRRRADARRPRSPTARGRAAPRRRRARRSPRASSGTPDAPGTARPSASAAAVEGGQEEHQDEGEGSAPRPHRRLRVTPPVCPGKGASFSVQARARPSS